MINKYDKEIKSELKIILGEYLKVKLDTIIKLRKFMGLKCKAKKSDDLYNAISININNSGRLTINIDNGTIITTLKLKDVIFIKD